MSLMQIESAPRSARRSAHLDKRVDGVHRADRITDGCLDVPALALDDRAWPVPCCGMSFRASKMRKTSMPFCAAVDDKALEDVVGVVAVAHDVLAAEQHLQAGFS